jgi:hypothetical protein
MQEIKNHTTLDQSVIKTLLYYDIFDYPLKASEVFKFLGVNSVTESDVLESLDELAEQQTIYRFGEFYGVRSSEANVIRRIKGNKEAEKYTTIAQKKARFIAQFPFVRAVMASGSLSKNYMDEKSDLDFFIVTSPNRLWIARTLLVLYKILFLNNSHKFLCINYFVDVHHLEIEEKNIFTATEVATLLPLHGAEYYQNLQRANSGWLRKYFPNFRPLNTNAVPHSTTGIFKKIMEKAIDLFFGNILETYCMNTTLQRWKRKHLHNFTEPEFNIAFKTKKYVSKSHPQHFQKKVLELFDQKLKEFNTKNGNQWKYD